MEAKEASTIILVRDTIHESIDVLMLKRNLQSGYVPGAHIFPGGEVDAADYSGDAMVLCDGITDEQASRRLGVARSGLAWWVAAIRECFEEAGLLLATPAIPAKSTTRSTRGSGGFVSLDSMEDIERFREYRTAVTADPKNLVAICRNEGLRLAAGSLHYFSHWVTPHGAPRRYDTRFFLAVAPSRQPPLPDSREIVETMWITPQDALAQYREGSFDMLIPTVKTLERLSKFNNTTALLEWAGSLQYIPTIQPRLHTEDGNITVLIPGDPGYEEVGDGPPTKPVTADTPHPRLSTRP
ncbi:MAG: NUDIX domain-containing protein [Actinobacteria bacterium]|nr:NUDIX domain-containing protein [Actinomycetota bacterium]MCL5447434.1 NUDIX domain-containing protein [Actinomycetota bacterium]